MSKVALIIGGARSGKSSLAESYAKSSNLPVTYIATAQAYDVEMQQRIKQHQVDRPDHWQLIESPLCLAKKIELAISNANTVNEFSIAGKQQEGICILVDCLTLWLTNCLCKPAMDNDDALGGNLVYWENEKQQFLTLLENIQQKDDDQNPIEIILVSNEVGHGIVPMGELSRQFVDQAGWLHQAIAKLADKVDFVMAGLPLTLKSSEKVN
ncbi:MAG: bifunctional adenosylcobinamide kinase/adenosylcobinamide-phosphate guanylyltransferase [Colwellia sp.]|nr:bifunctional adenosylcobinamide kinase/adenosylcobinamide-phosphate guanylyltransferase [Colwellia sp.]